MIGLPIPLALLFLGACSVPAQAPEEAVMLPIIVVEDTTKKPETSKQLRVPAIKPKSDPVPTPTKSTADTRCPPTEGETEQQRIIRKLDCLLERD